MCKKKLLICLFDARVLNQGNLKAGMNKCGNFKVPLRPSPVFYTLRVDAYLPTQWPERRGLPTGQPAYCKLAIG
jgi:hypothetical protein